MSSNNEPRLSELETDPAVRKQFFETRIAPAKDAKGQPGEFVVKNSIPDIPVLIKKEYTEEENKAALEALRERQHDNLPLPKEEPSLDPGAVYDLTKDIPNHPLPTHYRDGTPVDANLAVSRKITTRVFGGNMQETFPNIGQEHLERHGYRKRFMYMNTSYNPYLPTRPGKPGLFFASQDFDRELRPVMEWEMGDCYAFSRIRENEWIFQGTHHITFGIGLTVDEWETLADNVKKTWIEGTLAHDWGRPIRLRVLLRNRPGSDREIDLEEYQKLLDDKKKDYKRVPYGQVAEAFARGEEWIVAWKMRCIDFDPVFHRLIADACPKSKSKTKKEAKVKKEGIEAKVKKEGIEAKVKKEEREIDVKQEQEEEKAKGMKRSRKEMESGGEIVSTRVTRSRLSRRLGNLN